MISGEKLQAPFPWFGGKSKVSKNVWNYFGDVPNYVEPFFGSGAVLLGRPDVNYDALPKETVNDKDGFVSNFWRALVHAPDRVAKHAYYPQNENDLHARHAWLMRQRDTLVPMLEGDPDYYDAKIAGYWLWGIALWIGSGFCSGNGPWHSVENEDGTRKLIHLGDNGRGINRKLIHLGDNGRGINRQLIHLGNNGRGINRQLIHLGNNGRENQPQTNPLMEYMYQLHDRLKRVRVCSGDWKRVISPPVTHSHGLTGIFLDPPYASEANRTEDIYAQDDLSIAHEVREWAVSQGDNPLMRIALCGYEDEHAPHMPEDWEMVSWNASGGYGGYGEKENGKKERIWFSPHCIKQDSIWQASLW